MPHQVGNTPVPQRVFDPTYYLACYGKFLPKDVDPLTHYKKLGWKSGFNPNAFFSTRLYLVANPDALKVGVDPFEHFIRSSPGSHPYVSPIFDPRYYAANNAQVRSFEGAVKHYWREGRWRGASPNALFDVSFYRTQLRGKFGDVTDHLAHYLGIGWKEGYAPHPLFDVAFYQNQLDGTAKLIAPLAHYLECGWNEKLSPHPLFDPEYYVQNSLEMVNEAPLVHYLKRTTWDSTPHYLFSDTYYVEAAKKSSLEGTPYGYRSGPPLLHYCKIGASKGVTTHPLFDICHYKSQAERLVRDSDEAGLAVADIERDPLRHYCETGVHFGISPTPLFDLDFYRSQFRNRIEGDPLRHYLSPQGYSSASPHPAIDLDYYARTKGDFLPHELPVILDFLMSPKDERVSTHPAFDPKFYLERNPDVKEAELCPIEHFIRHGLKEARQPNPLFTYPYAHRLCKLSSPNFWNPVDGYFRALGNKRPRILFLGHDASKSGAPLVLLELVKHISQIQDIESIVILGRGGPLVDDYVHASLTYVVDNNDRSFLEWNRHSAQFTTEMTAIAELLEDNPPALVVCNSLESRHLANFFISHGFGPLVTLVHEVADPYDSAQISPLFAVSEMSIFVSEYQLDRMRKKVEFDESKTAVVQFGVLDRWFGSGEPAAARRKVQAELGLINDSLIVLACGTMNFRKGIDLFAEVACSVLARAGEENNIHFVWVGGGETHYDSAYYWAEKMVRDRGFDSNVHFVGERLQTEKYFLAADLFLLTSRADPFPCVIQEAMVCGLPVIAFEGASGAAEAVGDSGVIVPFGVASMANAVQCLLADDFQRQKLARRSKEILATKDLVSYAKEVFRCVAECAPRIFEMVLEQTALLGDTATERPSVLVALTNWDCSEASFYAEHVTKQLLENGFAAELLFTRGPGMLSRSDKPIPLPDVPFRFLYPKSQNVDHLREELLRHLTADRGPCVFIPYSDELAYDFVPILPSHVATMAVVHGESEEQLERVYSLSRHLDRIVCSSAETEQDLVEFNPRLKNKVSLIPPRATIDPKLAEIAIKARSKRHVTDKINIVCAGFGNGKISSAVRCVRLAKLLRDEQVAFHLTIVVSAAEARAIRAVAPDLVRCGAISLLESPTLVQIRDELERSDLLFFASTTGGTALIVAESMAVGCVPILQVARRVRKRGTKNGESAHFVEWSNLRKAAQLIRDYQRAPERLAKMSRAANRAFLRTMASEAFMAGRFAESCREALAARLKRNKEPDSIRDRVAHLMRSA